MRRPRVRITVERVGITKQDVMVLVVVMAVAMVLARGWSQGASAFGFESPFWDLGLIPGHRALPALIKALEQSTRARRSGIERGGA
jgi:hypothetical protein